MPDDAGNHGHHKRHAVNLEALIEAFQRDVTWLFKRIGRTEDEGERRRFLDKIVRKLYLQRLLKILLQARGPQCERCLAHQARITLSQAGAVLAELGQTITVSVRHTACTGCKQVTQTFTLAEAPSGSARTAAS